MENDRTAGAARATGEYASNIANSAMHSSTEYYREGSLALASTVQEQPLKKTSAHEKSAHW